MKIPTRILLAITISLFWTVTLGFSMDPVLQTLDAKTKLNSGLVHWGHYFTDWQKLSGGGYEVWSIEFNPGSKNPEFLLARLQKNPYLHWEELRMVGALVFLPDGNFELRPEVCGIYTISNPKDRWVLLRSYDCEHLLFHWEGNGAGSRLSPFPQGQEGALEWSQFAPLQEGKTPIYHLPDPDFPVWGLGLRRWRELPRIVPKSPGTMEILTKPVDPD